jgi:hypothetical protein
MDRMKVLTVFRKQDWRRGVVVDWTHLAQDRNKWCALLNMAMNFNVFHTALVTQKEK